MFLRLAILTCIVAVSLAQWNRHAGHGDIKTTTTTTVRVTQPDATNPPVPAGDRCFQCRSRRNQKDLYADETNCRFYYQCFYFNETYAIGYRRSCPAGQFWHDAVLSCMPEGPTPCVDQCLDSATAARGWYAGSNCRQYFLCSNTGSNGMCCPSGTAFNSVTGTCDLSETCTATCQQIAPAVPTTVAPAQNYNSTVCQDSFGTYIWFNAAKPNSYYLIDRDGQATEEQFCPSFVSFDLTTCRCDIDSNAVAPTPERKQRLLFFAPFNPTIDDVSYHKFKVFLFDGAYQDYTVTLNPGRASLNVNGGRAEVPGLKSVSYSKHISIGSHFRCASITSCTTGAILSNNNNADATEYTFIAYVQAPNTLVVRFNFWAPVGAIELRATFTTPADTWNKWTASYDGDSSVANLYINGNLVDTENVGGYLSYANCPVVIGNDQSVGTFNGWLDAVVIATWTFNSTDAQQFANANSEYAIAAGWAPRWWFGA